MENITTTIAVLLFENKIIDKQEIETCRYGLELFITTIIEFSAILLISIVAGNFAYTVVFLMSFIPIRIYSGGYHANTRMRCFMVLIMVYFAFTILVSNIDISQYIWFVIFVMIALIITVLKWSPVQTKKRDKYQITRFRRVSIVLSLINCLLTLVLVIKKSAFLTPMVFGMLAAVLSIAVGKIKYYERREKK